MTDHVSDGPIDRLVKARWLAIGLSQSDLAEVLGAAFKLKHDDRSDGPSSGRLRQIAEALELHGDLGDPARLQPTTEDDPLQPLLDLRLLKAFRELQDNRTKRTLIHLAEQMVKRQVSRDDSPR